MKLPPVIEKIVLHWGEMGARWGVNRSVAQIHALLWLIGRPMNAEEIAVTLVHTIGDRRNYYEAKGDTWDVVQTIVDERKKREIDPTLDVLRAARDLAETDEETPPDVKHRVLEMLGFIERMTGWYEQMRRVPRPMLQRLIKMGAGVARLIGSK
jgi:DNA-binding transcriptional regulator GbsR (MarR family)